MSCGVLERVDDPVRGPYRHLDQTYLMSNAFRKVIECDDGGEDGILFSAVMCLPTAPGSMGGPAWHGTFFSGVDTPLEPPRVRSDCVRRGDVGTTTRPACGNTSSALSTLTRKRLVSGTTANMNEDNVEKEEAGQLTRAYPPVQRRGRDDARARAGSQMSRLSKYIATDYTTRSRRL